MLEKYKEHAGHNFGTYLHYDDHTQSIFRATLPMGVNNFEISIFNGYFQIFRPLLRGVKHHFSLNLKFPLAFIHKTAPKNVW